MQPIDSEALEQAQWAEFMQQLASQLAAQWPAMPERLGDRYDAFVEHAVQQADKRGIGGAAAVARYVNLWFVWGPAFHDKPGFEWALGLLAAAREREWAAVHQLVRRSMLELDRLPDARIDPKALAAADNRLTDRFGALGRRGAMRPTEAPPLPRSACDLEAGELRLLEPAVTQQYVLAGGQWQRVALPLPAPVRIDGANPMPPLIGVLSHPPGVPGTRLQLRTRMHAVCDPDVHAALVLIGSHGLWRWHGHETRAVSWPVATLEQATPKAGPGTAIAEETSPDICRMALQVCGLRDEADALGTQNSQLWVWPAAQWWLELQRQAPAPQPVSAGKDWAVAGSTHCRVECDGQAADVVPLRTAFEAGLERATTAALQRLLGCWTRVEGLSLPRLEGALALLTGRAALTWGWRLGVAGMAGAAFMRVVGELEMKACMAELQFDGELALGGARSRIALRIADAATLAMPLRHEATEPPLLETMLPAMARFRLPMTAELTPIASDTGALMQAGGPCSGALVGEAGLRPRTSGGSGWEWFASLRLEAASVPLQWVDPVLGLLSQVHPLWPEQTLLDWKLA